MREGEERGTSLEGERIWAKRKRRKIRGSSMEGVEGGRKNEFGEGMDMGGDERVER